MARATQKVKLLKKWKKYEQNTPMFHNGIFKKTNYATNCTLLSHLQAYPMLKCSLSVLKLTRRNIHKVKIENFACDNE